MSGRDLPPLLQAYLHSRPAHHGVPHTGMPLCVVLILATLVQRTQVGRRSVLFACSWALLVSCVELTTTLAVHTWLRRGFLACRRTKVD